jgi:hypothetical protein
MLIVCAPWLITLWYAHRLYPMTDHTLICSSSVSLDWSHSDMLIVCTPWLITLWYAHRLFPLTDHTLICSSSVPHDWSHSDMLIVCTPWMITLWYSHFITSGSIQMKTIVLDYVSYNWSVFSSFHNNITSLKFKFLLDRSNILLKI